MPATVQIASPTGTTTSCCCHDDAAPGLGVSDERWSRTWLKVAIALVIAGQGMIFGLGYNTADPRPEFGTPVYWLLNGGLFLSAVVVMTLLGPPLFAETWQTLRRGRLTVESLFTLTMLGAFGGSLLSTLTGEGNLYYEVVAIVLSIYTIGKTLGARSRQRALEAAQRLRTDFDHAWIAACGPEGRRRVPLAQLKPGQRVLVAPGEPVTVDGHIVRGGGYVAETAINGETEPVRRGVGQEVFAGSYAVDAMLEIEAYGLVGARKLDAILATIESARLRPSRLQAQADRLTRYFVPFVLTVAVGTFLGWSAYVSWQKALFDSMAVLLVACPCALGLATPIAVWTGLMNLSRLGLVCGSGDFLDVMAGARHLVFDKTGTLSGERLSLAAFRVLGGADEQRLRALIEAAERPIRHPVAEPLKELGASPELVAACAVADSQVVPGLGLKAVVNGPDGKVHSLLIGTLELMSEAARAVFNKEAVDFEAKRLVFVSCDGQAAAIIALEEKLRADAEAMIGELRELGTGLAIVSGDPQPRWKDLAGVTVMGGMLPEAKVRFVQELEARHEPVIFIGDGVNDAAAMAVSSGGIAMGAGADLTKAAASAVLAGESLRALPAAIRVCRRIRQAVRGNLVFAFSYNVLGMGLAAAGVLHPVVAALLMLGSSVFVSWRAARSARIEEPAAMIEIDDK
ncbi:heavy metal translocating P-type ATPase [Ruficoccus amylovorans]|uniref:Heavy metal translocating P-type ATPase n=1 Tax=Ruficoccus amylovorans TaxID=1804625 RepID=A0A842HHM5_9BACT|nr:heavy metal translocating P-type ATPase [Ruficoccus amylovorans]MBC2595047.1 heavy metal translocating P-type ATPase [Ruficoccus amylovorans]